MKRERKIYDPAFKIKAVELSNERSNITELSRELGIQVSMLYKWRKEYSQFGSGSFPGKGVLKQPQSKK
jgi:transposase